MFITAKSTQYYQYALKKVQLLRKTAQKNVHIVPSCYNVLGICVLRFWLTNWLTRVKRNAAK